MPVFLTDKTIDQSVDLEEEKKEQSSMVQLRSVTKTYTNGTTVLLDVNFEVKQGSFLFISGSSGSGKSTLLKLLYGEELPTKGEVIVDRYNVGALQGDRLSLFRRRIGIVFQDYKLIPQRTVAENVSIVLLAQGYTRKEIQRRLEPTLKLVGLLSKAESFPNQLSGGEQQRVSIARAIVGTPPLLLADEPTGNLDPDNSWQIMQILQKLNSFGVTVIVTTHDEQLMRRCNHSVVQLRNGQLYKITNN
ncbi:cell division ATP-binding protein FtsE [Aetokthonos hydrillicola Thurmond2011]|jgi:cell division transport system ATP-binding protein|uniref:Cell division ATP-binding protein FtsE n=1 Tax=Aetokthonos hydrillicola Thurmond2011 TaxID=2712845 RepID=A0AAP5IDK6_9CYAN|nr:cell division ATP-binding protein FtsE [Aetokthonos hydrillicola]MBW4585784.1 cell division ATP-binding protein FtsE [Aetokthonos hydrillicola CCALA 1050]MDR9899287.1 cell division ATP-binding protein FtsE [Aetokthonos hydrillicola Thurmond2011]